MNDPSHASGKKVPKSMEKILLRVDADIASGTGHFMRCLALSETFLDGGMKSLFVLAKLSPRIKERLLEEGIETIPISCEPGSVADARETIRIARDFGVVWVIVDGYHFRGNYQKIFQKTGLRLLVIDDYGHSDHYFADIILNQNSYADLSLYPRHEPGTRFLFGTDYVVLRREFLKWKGTSRIISDSVQKILVTLGGSDPDNATLSVIEALKNIGMKGIEVIVIVGGLNPNSDLIVRSISDYDSFSLRTDVRNMPELMAWADLVITGGGSTCWELIFMRQKPLVIVIAENQRKIAEGLDAAGEAYYIGTSHDITVRQLTEKIRNALSVYEKKDRSVVIGGGLVDGSGGARIVREMERRSGGSS